MFVIDSKQLAEGAEWTKPLGFIGHPKTASQATRAALRRAGARSPGGHHGLDEEECERIIKEGGIICSTVRNPWDLMVSWYGFSKLDSVAKGADPPEFSDWLRRTLESGNGWIEKGFYGTQYCNRIIRFEHNIEKQLNNILAGCGLPPVYLEVVGKSDRKPYQEYYTPSTAILVDRCFDAIINEWGYSFEEIKGEEI